MYRRPFILVLALCSAFLPVAGTAQPGPGETYTTNVLSANFDADVVGLAPDVTLPGAPTGDFLTLNQAAGSIVVEPSVDGLTKPAHLKQANTPGGIGLFSWAVPSAGAERVTVAWRSVAQDDNPVSLIVCGLRSASGALLASVEYTAHGVLTYNATGGAGQTLPIVFANNRANQFSIVLDFLAGTSSLSIDGAPVVGFQNVAFAQPGSDFAQLGFEGVGDHPQSFSLDDLSAVATFRMPDGPPTVSAPPAVAGAEAAPLAFTVTASDPDVQEISSLTASPLPAGAAFTPSLDNTSGEFAWTPDHDQAGSYSVTFTASNTFSASAATAITIANTDRAPIVSAAPTATGAEAVPFSLQVSASDPDGDAIASLTTSALPPGATFTPSLDNATGELIWTPSFGQAGSYSVTFTAANGLSGSATTAITIAHTDRAPLISAPVGIAGEEGGTMAFTVAASDPDGDGITSLTADLGALPAANDASFTTSADHMTGAFIWHMQPGDAGSYSVTFTASNLLTSTFTTAVYVGQAGVGVAGVFHWTPQPGDEGVWYVTWSATDAGGTSTEQTEITVVSGSLAPAAAPNLAPRSVGAGLPPNVSRVPLAPQNPMKGPIISAPRAAQTTTDSDLTLSAYAETDLGALVASPAAGLNAGSIQRSPSTATRVAAISLAADLTGLPADNDAEFVVDQEPQVTAPIALTVDAGTPVSFQVSVSEPNGDPIESLTANIQALPAGNNAAFSVNGAHNAGTLTWTPTVTDAGIFPVSFAASNRLVGTATTVITVRAAAATRIFITGSAKLQLGSNRQFWCGIEPVAGSFNIADVEPASIRMISPGTGSVSEIPIQLGKTVAIGDKDGNLIQDMSVSFAKADLRRLFDGLTGKTTLTVVIQARLFSGSFVRGNLTMDVVPTNKGPLAASVYPNPLNPEAKLEFTLPQAGFVRARMYDLQGRLVRTLLDEQDAAAGPRTVMIDGRSNSGGQLASGVYFFRIESRGGAQSGRIVIVQ